MNTLSSLLNFIGNKIAGLGALSRKDNVSLTMTARQITGKTPQMNAGTAGTRNYTVPSAGADYTPVAVVAVWLSGEGSGVITMRGFDLDGISAGSDATVKVEFRNNGTSAVADNFANVAIQVLFIRNKAS